MQVAFWVYQMCEKLCGIVTQDEKPTSGNLDKVQSGTDQPVSMRVWPL